MMTIVTVWVLYKLHL